MSNQFVGIAGMVGLFVMFGGPIYYFYLNERKRTQAFSQVAGQMGLAFHPKGDAAFSSALPDLPVLAGASSQSLI